MLRQRLITAAILGILLIAGIFVLPTKYVALICAVFVLVGAWEWARLAGIGSAVGRAGFAAGTALLMAAASWMLDQHPDRLFLLLIPAALWWLAALGLIINYPQNSGLWSAKPVKIVCGLLVLVPMWVAVSVLHASPSYGPDYLMYLLLLIWAADSAAYFGGRAWGRRKLAVAVSPGKTWEGALTAAVAVLAVAWGGVIVLDIQHGQGAFLFLAIITLVFSIVGDLSESMYKRQAGVKDSGTLLPGHGGVLDRIDSLTAAAPIFVLGLLLGSAPV